MEFGLDDAEPGKFKAVMIKTDGPGCRVAPIGAEQQAQIVQGARPRHSRGIRLPRGRRKDGPGHPRQAQEAASTTPSPTKPPSPAALIDDFRAVEQGQTPAGRPGRKSEGKASEEHVGLPPIDMMPARQLRLQEGRDPPRQHRLPPLRPLRRGQEGREDRNRRHGLPEELRCADR